MANHPPNKKLRAILLALLIHIVITSALFITFRNHSPVDQSNRKESKMEVINATLMEPPAEERIIDLSKIISQKNTLGAQEKKAERIDQLPPQTISIVETPNDTNKQSQQQIEAQQRQQAEAERRQQAEAQRRQQAEAQRRQQAEAQRRQQAEAQRRQQAEAQRRQQAEAQRRQQVEVQRRQQAEVQRRQQAEVQRRQQAEAQRRQQAEAQRRQQAEAQRRQQAEAQRRQQVEVQRRQQAEAQRRQQAEAQRRQQAEAQRRQQAEAQRRQQAEAQRRQQAEAQRRQQVEVQRRQQAEAQRRQQAEAQRRQQAEAQRRQQAPLRSRNSNAPTQSTIPGFSLSAIKRATEEWKTRIQRRVNKQWRTPRDTRGMRAIVTLSLETNNKIRHLRINQCLGSPLFCDSLIAALHQSVPYPRPRYKELYRRNLRFIFSTQ